MDSLSAYICLQVNWELDKQLARFCSDWNCMWDLVSFSWNLICIVGLFKSKGKKLLGYKVAEQNPHSEHFLYKFCFVLWGWESLGQIHNGLIRVKEEGWTGFSKGSGTFTQEGDKQDNTVCLEKQIYAI